MVFSPTSVFFTKQLSGGQINEEIMLTAFFFFFSHLILCLELFPLLLLHFSIAYLQFYK